MINPITEDRFFVITGGPGSGKTTLIEALASRGLARSTEAGRAIIRDQASVGGQDTERKQTFEEAVETYDVMVETYATYGYNLITLPLVSVEERVQFVTKEIFS
jgi:predicted ATPase